MKKFRRKQYIINPRFQLRFVYYIGIVAFVNAAIVIIANKVFIWRLYEKGRKVGLSEDHVFFSFLNYQDSSLTITSLISAAVLFIVMGLFGLKMSHRVAGPLYRLNQHMRGVANGELGKHVKFRKGDFFPELAEAYNMQYDFLSKKK